MIILRGAERWVAILGITDACYHVFLLFVFSMEPWTWVATYSDYKGNETIGGFCELKLLVLLKTFLLLLACVVRGIPRKRIVEDSVEEDKGLLDHKS